MVEQEPLFLVLEEEGFALKHGKFKRGPVRSGSLLLFGYVLVQEIDLGTPRRPIRINRITFIVNIYCYVYMRIVQYHLDLLNDDINKRLYGQKNINFNISVVNHTLIATVRVGVVVYVMGIQ